MPEPIQELIARVVAQVIEERTAELRAEVARRLAEQLGPATEAAAPAANPSAQLNSAVQRMQNSTSQAEILGGLLEGAAAFAGRVALFVTRGSNAVGWQARGLADDSAIKRFSLDLSTGLVARALQDRMPVSAAARDFSREMVSAIGNPADGNCILLPLVVRDKVPALLYADAGAGDAQPTDSSALELLVRTAGLWLEVVAVRRGALAEPAAAAAERGVEEPPPPREEPEPVPAPVAAPAPVAPPPAEPPAPPAPAPAAISPGDQEVHKKAKRFAKLLVDEIRLYNKTKVEEGRKRKDLYKRLKDDIDKSRASYDKRYASSPAAEADYFTQELIRILADGDPSLLGDNFPQASQ